MEEGVEETELKDQHQTISNPPLPREPFTWLMIIDGANGERQTFYSLTEDRYYVRNFPEFQNKYIACCYGGWLVLKDKFTNDCSMLNVLTMEKLQLPPLPIDPDEYLFPCVMSSTKMDTSCRIMFFDGPGTFRSCNIGDSEFIEREVSTDYGAITRSKNFKGKLHALTYPGYNLVASDFLDPDLHQELVISGESIANLTRHNFEQNFYLVDSCDDLLLVLTNSYNYVISDVEVYRADFSSREWMKKETLGDRAIFLEFHYTSSSPASAYGLKSNAVYFVSFAYSTRHIYVYDLEDKSISMCLPCPIVEFDSSLFWLFIPNTCNEEKPQNEGMCIFEASPTKRNFHLQRQKATLKCKESQIELRKTHKKEESGAICSTIIQKGSSWADLLGDLLLEILSYLYAGDRAAFYCVCRSWYSVSSMATSQRFGPPLKISDCSSPFLMCAKILHPIYGKVHGMDLPDIPGANVRAARDGWLLMDEYSHRLFFYNPLTKVKLRPPDCGARFFHSLYFSAPPTSADCFIVAAVRRWDDNEAICYIKRGDPSWTNHIIMMEDEFSYFSFCNPVVYKGMYYFLGVCAELIEYDPTEDKHYLYDAPEPISDFLGQKFLLESDGNLIAVLVNLEGSSVYTCQWNFSEKTWEILGSLGNRMLFVSRPLSLCQTATVSGTGNKIYFPRVVGDDHVLFYSLATKRYHTFEMGTSYENFFGSKIYPQCDGSWFVP